TMRGTNDRIYPAPVPAIAGAKRVRPHQIRFENASFRKTKNFSYTFEPGYTQINGANGGGKTSMLYTAAGVSQPTEGRALISDAQGVQRDAFFMDGRLKRSMRFIPSQPQVVVFQHVAGNGYTIGAERYLTPRQFITEEDPSRDIRRLKRFDAEWLL